MSDRESPAITREQLLALGRESFQRQAWTAAFTNLTGAEQQAPLEPQDLILLAQAALLIGRDSEGMETLARAHQGFASCGQVQPAARCAFWLGFMLMIRGEAAKGGGWLSRASRLLDGQPECAENGYLLVAQAYRLFHSNDPAAAQAIFNEAAGFGQRFADKDLLAMCLQGQGRAMIRQGEIARGVALLDEAMVAVTAGEVSALNAGGVYCSVLDACSEIFDLQRANEWTIALERWCDSHPDMVPYRGHCLVRRAELCQMRGSWAEALQIAQRASEWLCSRGIPGPDAGAACYQVAEVLRLLGKFEEAEQAYLKACQLYWCPGPGLARLRLAQGRVDAACTLVRRLLEEVHETAPRVKVLAAYVEIALAAKDTPAATAAAAELEAIAARRDIPFLHALSACARGAVLLAGGKAAEAFTDLRRSWSLWRELPAPYEAARLQVLIAAACQETGDVENAQWELRAACDAFRQLGAQADLSVTEGLLSKLAAPTGPLTDREVQVLKLVAAGLTNRAIAGRLKISEKTVARHLSNIFTKLDLPSRTAAAAYAFEHSLV